MRGRRSLFAHLGVKTFLSVAEHMAVSLLLHCLKELFHFKRTLNIRTFLICTIYQLFYIYIYNYLLFIFNIDLLFLISIIYQLFLCLFIYFLHCNIINYYLSV